MGKLFFLYKHNHIYLNWQILKSYEDSKRKGKQIFQVLSVLQRIQEENLQYSRSLSSTTAKDQYEEVSRGTDRHRIIVHWPSVL